MKKITKKIMGVLFLICAAVFIVQVFIESALAQSKTTHINLQITGQPMTIISIPQVSFGSVVAVANSQVVQTRIPAIEVADYRGEASGWTATVLATPLGIRGEYAQKRKISTGSVSNATISDVSVSGHYNGSNAARNADGAFGGEFLIEVLNTAGNPASPALISLTKPDGSVVNLPVLNRSITFNGLIIYFPETLSVFDVKDRFGITVYAFSATYLSIKTSNLLSAGIIPSSTDGIIINPDDARIRTEYSLPARTHASVYAEWARGIGRFKFDDDLSWTIPPNPLPGVYEATLIYTLI